MHIKQYFLVSLCLLSTLTVAMNSTGSKKRKTLDQKKSDEELVAIDEQTKLRRAAITTNIHETVKRIAHKRIAHKVEMKENTSNCEEKSAEMKQAAADNMQKLLAFVNDPNSTPEDIKQILKKLEDSI